MSRMRIIQTTAEVAYLFHALLQSLKEYINVESIQKIGRRHLRKGEWSRSTLRTRWWLSSEHDLTAGAADEWGRSLFEGDPLPPIANSRQAARGSVPRMV